MGSWEEEAGYQFERFMASLFMDDERFTILKGPTRYRSGANTSHLPDLKIQINGTDITFWIECKYRSRIYKMLDWTDYGKLKFYQEFYKNLENSFYYVAVGVEGDPRKPQRLFFDHFTQFEHPRLYPSKYRDLEWNSSYRIPDSLLTHISKSFDPPNLVLQRMLDAEKQ